MSELSFSNANKPHFSISLLLSDLMLLFSSIISHPLYFLYFVFFSPYIFKLLSFLSPLHHHLPPRPCSPHCLSTLLLSPESSDSKLGFLLEKCGSVLDKLRPIVDGQCEDLRCFEELEAYKIVFEAATFEVRDEERQPLELESEEKHCLPAFEGAVVVKTENVAEEKRGEGLLEVGEDGNISEKVKDKKVKAVGAESDKVDGQEERLTTGVSEGMGSKIGEIALRVTADNGGDYTSKGADDSQMVAASVKVVKEKEWKRTLACKLFEERNNADGGEGMDLLWETYETDSSKWEEDEEEEEEGMDRQLCCLQALKFSAGKMNLGMGRPNLVKFTKALKGIGWLHQVSRHGRKAHR
ncbi:hypothetical protein CK203_091023 [Vitis vinifera]|uniref:Uncharacterized protein n=1 Tax=Vitis vinifera TaxID=29760 RepID=A0A438BV26_VITVI|nr:hypothetical protein CK203_091023 [Vitis vinifera]